jgi:hypothetical protein
MVALFALGMMSIGWMGYARAPGPDALPPAFRNGNTGISPKAML